MFDLKNMSGKEKVDAINSISAALVAITFLIVAACIIVFMMVYERRAHGSPLDCMQIKDTDQRNLCLAVSKQDKSFCSFIKDNDTRAKCRAQVK